MHLSPPPFPSIIAGAGLAALLGVGVFGIGPAYLSEAERADYTALSGGPGTGGLHDEVRRSGMSGDPTVLTAAPAGTF